MEWDGDLRIDNRSERRLLKYNITGDDNKLLREYISEGLSEEYVTIGRDDC